MAKNNDKQQRTASLGFEDKLWASADLLRNNMDPAEYKHVVLGLLFLKYIEDAFEERQQVIRAAFSDTYDDDELAAMLEDRDEYTAENVFWVSASARWSAILAQAKRPAIGKTNLSPTGTAGFVLANGSMSSQQSNSVDGTKMPRTKWADLCRLPIAVPPAEAANKYTELINLIFERMWLMAQSRTLGDWCF